MALADIDEEAVRAAAEQLTASGHKALAIRCDVTEADQRKRSTSVTKSGIA